MRLVCTVPPGNDRGPQYVEQVLDALHQANQRRRAVRLEIGRCGDEVTLRAETPDALAETFRRQFQASYPDSHVIDVRDDTRVRPTTTKRLPLRLHPRCGMLRTWQEFRDDEVRVIADPLSGVFAAVADTEFNVTFSFVVRPAGWWTRFRARRRAPRERLASRLHSARLHVEVASNDRDAQAIRRKVNDVVAALGAFTSRDVTLRRAWSPWSASVLSTPDLATLWHPPTSVVRTERIATVSFREREPPAVLPTPKTDRDIAVLGRTAFRGRREVFGIKPEDRLRHVFLCGKTGMGKSTQLRSLLASDIADGRGCCLIDPHGDLAEAVLQAVPKRRRNDVVSFDAGNRTSPPAFNPLHCPRVENRPLVASGVIAAFKKIHGDSWGPRLEHILRNGLLALLEQPHATLGDLQRLLGDAAFRRRVIARLRDPVVRAFFTEEFGRWNPRFRAEAIAPVQNKVGSFLANPILRAIVNQRGNGLDLRRVMDRGQVLVVNLSKGRIGEDGSALLGALLVSSLQLAAMSRTDTAEASRRPFYLYVDEFQNVATESFVTILSEARKYGLGLTVANQFLEQIEETTLAALFGNVGTIVAFQVGARDAETLAEQLGGEVQPSDLLNLPKFHAYVRLLIDGMPSRNFSMRTIAHQSNRSSSKSISSQRRRVHTSSEYGIAK